MMKKNMIALAVASAIAAPVAMADAPTVYGQINMSIDNVTDKGTGVGSNASRVGVKGSQDLGNGLKAVYKMEWQVDVAGSQKIGTTSDAGAATGTTTLKDRNAFLGLAGGFGTVLMGRHDTPMKMSQPTDTFNDGFGDNKPMAGKLGVVGAAGEARATNVLAYVSPSFNGVKIVGAGVSNNAGKDTSLFGIYSLAAMYGSTKKGLFLSAAYNSWSDKALTAHAGTPVADSATETRVSAQYKVAGLMGNIMYQNFDKSTGGNDGSNYQINVSYDMGKFTPKIKYSMVDYKASTSKDSTNYGVGVDYAMAKKTSAYVEYVSYDKNNKANSAGKDSTMISVGLLTKF